MPLIERRSTRYRRKNGITSLLNYYYYYFITIHVKFILTERRSRHQYVYAYFFGNKHTERNIVRKVLDLCQKLLFTRRVRRCTVTVKIYLIIKIYSNHSSLLYYYILNVIVALVVYFTSITITAQSRVTEKFDISSYSNYYSGLLPRRLAY